MEDQKVDRRVKLTKRILKETLIQLLKENDLPKISVKELCEIADVNRSTFYAYYTDVYDLLSQIEKETLHDINEFIFMNPVRPENSHELLCVMLQYAYQNADLFQILMNEKNISNFRKAIIDLVNKLALYESQLGQIINPREKEYIQMYSINGFFGVLDKWLKDGMVEPIGEMADLIINLLDLGIIGYQNRKNIHFNGHRASSFNAETGIDDDSSGGRS